MIEQIKYKNKLYALIARKGFRKKEIPKSNIWTRFYCKNHFIEICVDEDDFIWVMLHSGSRGIGNKIGMTFIRKAKEDMRIHQVNLPDSTCISS